MLTLSRNYHGLSKKAVAAKILVSSPFITYVEDGVKTPSIDTMKRLTDELGFPKAFYHQPGTVESPPISLFRKRRVIDNTTLTKCAARISILKKSLELLLNKVEPPSLRLPNINPEEREEGAQEAARITRRALRIPPGPIFNLTMALEAAGILVIPFDFGTQRIDGYSDWAGDVPFILFNRETPRSRLRHTLAHETGHLVMHNIVTEDCEDEANSFAAEMNMPASEILHQLPPVRLDHLAQLKIHWRCSMSALLYRAFYLGVISPRMKRYYWSRMRRYGYHKSEPYEDKLPKETPVGVKELLGVFLYQMGLTRDSLIEYLRLFEEPFSRFFAYDNITEFEVLDGGSSSTNT